MGSLDLSGLDAPAPADDTASKAPLRKFEEDPDNPRTEFDGPEFDAFVEDVRQRGILQPVVVQTMPSGKFRIRFGARRFRAAKRLDLAMLPYVVADDERHLDAYAQVSENEQRKGLEPLELAKFISLRLGEGASKAQIASKLGLASSAVTYLLALVDPPAFIRELYDSRRCRSTQLLYRLRKLHADRPDAVESRLAVADEITTSLVDSLTAQLDEAQDTGNIAALAGQLETRNVVDPLRSGPVQSRPTVRKKLKRKSNADGARRIKVPVLTGKFETRDVTLTLTTLPSKPGRVHVRHADDGSEVEVLFTDLKMLKLTEAAS